jgi:hypothetical protein
MKKFLYSPFFGVLIAVGGSVLFWVVVWLVFQLEIGL